MKLLDLINRTEIPMPWEEGDNIPWNDPDFSARMLKEHLSQSHDAASRRTEIIDKQVCWIHQELLKSQPTHILDLGCGPGLYTSRFARLGHTCEGIDFSPASIKYAVDQATQEHLPCTYNLQDIRQAAYGSDYGLVMLIFGEFNVFRPADIKTILTKAWHALDDNGLLLLEPHTFTAVHKIGKQSPTWHSARSGLFSDQPYILLEENFWDPASSTATIRYLILDTASGEVTRWAQSFQAYTDEDYHTLLAECGYKDIQFYPSLMGVENPSQKEYFALVARK